MTIIELKAAIEAKKTEIKEKQAEIDSFEYESTEEEYDNFLSEAHGDAEICGQTYSPGYALRLVDETAYRTGKSDYDDSFDHTFTPEYANLQSELEGLESELEDLESELEEAEENE